MKLTHTFTKFDLPTYGPGGLSCGNSASCSYFDEWVKNCSMFCENGRWKWAQHYPSARVINTFNNPLDNNGGWSAAMNGETWWDHYPEKVYPGEEKQCTPYYHPAKKPNRQNEMYKDEVVHREGDVYRYPWGWPSHSWGTYNCDECECPGDVSFNIFHNLQN